MPGQELAALPTAKDQDFEPFWLRHARPLPFGNSGRTTSVCRWRFLYCSDPLIALILASLCRELACGVRRRPRSRQRSAVRKKAVSPGAGTTGIKLKANEPREREQNRQSLRKCTARHDCVGRWSAQPQRRRRPGGPVFGIEELGNRAMAIVDRGSSFLGE